MIEMEDALTVRENVHQLVDTLSEDRLGDVLDYLTDLGVDTGDTDETLSAATEAAIEEGLDDIRNGRTISLEEYRRSRGM
jgi:predicted transcriptional regulator